MNRRAYLAAVGTSLSASLAGCTSTLGVFDDSPCSGDDCTIGMTRNEFLPREYEATVGETVVWKNTSGAIHTITALESGIPDDAEYFATGGFEDDATAREQWRENHSGGLDTRETFEHTFEVPGRYEYICIPHVNADMVGTIIVSE
ncbi:MULTISPECIES: cupredoxin domain-containing protein [Natrialba]|uniref:Blue (Type 1) copper domain-containing protein n=2 Tax=Natrialba TaxID=63742 RepID=M0B9Y4_9EURY|nr:MULTISPECIES: plastocyanin/azurin family copper-binding protein [Natrialba]ELY92672.1 blue (type 1) copper domain-containing protein [Natrialba taiwanensis DSM 12281]ELZ07297.1 blue (type 1) copper domain-containing protein [Natrialba aegyptia DSM 13077]